LGYEQENIIVMDAREFIEQKKAEDKLLSDIMDSYAWEIVEWLLDEYAQLKNKTE